MNLLLNSINKGSEIHTIYHTTFTVDNARSFTQHLLHKKVNNQFFSRHKEPSKFSVIDK